MTAGVDIGDKYSYLFVLDNDGGEVVEEGRLRTTPDDLRRRFDSAQRMKIAIEVGTHSTWVSRLLEECGHEVLIANPRKTRLIYGEKRKRPISLMPRSWPVLPGPTPSFSTQ